MRISDWSSDVCSSDLAEQAAVVPRRRRPDRRRGERRGGRNRARGRRRNRVSRQRRTSACRRDPRAEGDADRRRSEEHTSELQSLMRQSYAVFCLKTKITTAPAAAHIDISQGTDKAVAGTDTNMV